MGLVDYDSDGSGSSDGETAPPAKTTTTTTTTTATITAGGKKPFQKLVDRANPGKILVNLPSAVDTKGDDDDGRPAKRAKVGAGGSRFSGFGSFLPPPKKTGATAAAAATPASSSSNAESPSTSSASPSSTPSTSRLGVNLKTSSEAAFSRRDNSGSDTLPGSENNTATTSSSSFSSSSSRMALPPPKVPSIPKDQKAAEDVKLVGNPLMFMPLSVSRKPGGKKKKPVGVAPVSAASAKQSPVDGAPNSSRSSATPPAAPPPKKKVSLFSLGADDQAEAEKASAAERAAEEAAAVAAAAAESAATDDYQSVDYSSSYQAPNSGYGHAGQQGYYGEDPAASSPSAVADTTSLNAFADNMHLSAKERRELFGRTGSAAASAQIAATFNMDQEYRHNEQLRQAEESAAQNGGQQQSHNPVRTLMPGKHSLRQLVNQVQSQQDAFEETFAKNRQSQREAGGKYGWR